MHDRVDGRGRLRAAVLPYRLKEDDMEHYHINREEMIAKVINTRYSIDEQIALLRQRDSKPEEYDVFYAFAEEVKRKVSEEYAQYGEEVT